MTKTQRSKRVFTVKEYGDGTPWIYFERLGKALDIEKSGSFGFDLPKGTSYKEAQKVAKLLNEKLESFIFTS